MLLVLYFTVFGGHFLTILAFLLVYILRSQYFYGYVVQYFYDRLFI